MIKNYDLTEFDQHRDFPFHIDDAVLTEDFEMHTHSFIELVIILSGSGTHVVDGREFELKPGDVFVVSGYLSHGFKNTCNLHLYNIMFDMRIFQPSLSEFKKLAGFQSLFIFEPYYRKKHEFNSRLVLDADGLVYVEAMIRIILKEFEKNRVDSGIILKMYFLSLVAYLSRKYTGKRNSYTQDVYFLAEAVSYMENNYTFPIKVKEIANRAHLSERHFSRVFTQNYHMPPMEYVLKLRLQHAQKLLKNSSLSVSQIAGQGGFYDTSALSRTFKAKFGLSPSEYRRLLL